jgi:hypothetical protein
MGKNEGADELLSAFNVATFKSAEDDKAFWNRLIPVDVQNTETGKQQVRRQSQKSYSRCRISEYCASARVHWGVDCHQVTTP